jgi:hypothetical protein
MPSSPGERPDIMQDQAGTVMGGTTLRRGPHKDRCRSWVLRNFPLLDGLLRPGYGFDVYGTCDGSTWSAQTTNAFGDGLYNFGLRTMASTREGFFLGSANHIQGTAVWREAGATCGQTGSTSSRTVGALGAPPRATTPNERSAGSTAEAAAPPPASAAATSASCGSVVSWQPSPGATRYVVSRSADKTIRGVALEPPPRLPGGFSLPSIPEAVSSPTAAIPIPAPYARLAVTTQTSYVDRSAKPGVHYQYKITPENGSSPGPVSTVVGQTPPTTATQIRAQITSLAADGQLSSTKARGLKTRLTAVDKAPQVASVQARALRSLAGAVKPSGASSAAVADLGAAVSSLARSIVSAQQGCGGRAVRRGQVPTRRDVTTAMPCDRRG